MKTEVTFLESRNYYLREVVDLDIENIYKGLSNKELIKYYGVSYSSLEETKVQMDWYAELRKNGTGIWWGIYSKTDDSFLGAGGLSDLSATHKKAELGFWLLPEYWGQGIMTETVPAIIQYAFRDLKLHRIEGFVESDNVKCKKAIVKVNFKHEGTMRDCEVKDGKFISLDIYALLNPKDEI